MEINSKSIAELRQITGVGIVECKNALISCEGDVAKAVSLLREKGLSKAVKGDRVTEDGAISIVVNPTNTAASMIYLASETDFVARNENFHAIASKIGRALLAHGKEVSAEDALHIVTEDKVSIDECIKEGIMTIREQIRLLKSVYLSEDNGYVAAYTHSAYAENCGRIGVILSMQVAISDANRAAVANLAKQIAMHIAGLNPMSLDRESLPESFVQSEKSIIEAQLSGSGKSPEIAAKMLEGKMAKVFSQHVLLEQEFVMDPSMKVADLINTVSKEIGAEIKLTRFHRFAVKG